MSSLLQVWNEWEIQLMVLSSFMLQLFLMLTGNLRRRYISRPLRGLIWLAYVGADSVAVYALGLFYRYEDKYKLGGHSYGDTLPFLWVPFLLVHLGGQDSITAFSIEDNNLWLRHLLNLGIQAGLALHLFWKSFHRIHSLVLTPAAFIFVSGIIKYGERTWALKSGSRDGLGAKSKGPSSVSTPRENNRNNAIYSYALETVLLARGLFVGRTMFQLGDGFQEKLEEDFDTYERIEEKVKIIMTELGMMFDLLYSKAMVLQKLWGCIFRCVAQISMVVAFVLFIRSANNVHNRVNVAISYTLFIGAISMECCSIAIAVASPWSRAHMQEGSFLYRFFSKVMELQRNKKLWLSISIGQFNRMDFSITEESKPRMITKILSALGLEQKWRILWYTKHIEAPGIIEHVVNWFDEPEQERFRRLQLNLKLNHELALPFEHTLYHLHVYTDLHISRHFGGPAGSCHADDVMLLKDECEKLSNYMSYLMAVYPSMLPVSAGAEDVGHGLPQWLKNCGQTTKPMILEKYAAEVLLNLRGSACPFEPAEEQDESGLKRSLESIKEMWVRLLIYSAGKCRGELHARQLGNGGELLTFVWLLMVHHGLGDVATELNLLKSDDPAAPEVGSLVSVKSFWTQRPEQPSYAFDFRRRHQPSPQERQQLQFLQDETKHHEVVISPTMAEQDEAGTSGGGRAR